MDWPRDRIFTVWCEGELVGESDLGFLANTSQVKLGHFAATEYGERIIAIRMAPRKALCARASWNEIEALEACREAAPLELRAPDGRIVSTDDIEITDLEWLCSLIPSEEADWQADLHESDEDLLELILPETEPADELDDILEASISSAEDLRSQEQWAFTPDLAWLDESEHPRYQVQVQIRGGG